MVAFTTSYPRVRENYHQEPAGQSLEPELEHTVDLETWIAEQSVKAPPLPIRVRDSFDLEELSSLMLFAADQGIGSWDASRSTAA